MAEKIEDISRARIVRASAEALGRYLQDKRLLEKKIWQLQMTELEGMVDAAISAFIVEEARERQSRGAETTPGDTDFVD